MCVFWQWPRFLGIGLQNWLVKEQCAPDHPNNENKWKRTSFGQNTIKRGLCTREGNILKNIFLNNSFSERNMIHKYMCKNFAGFVPTEHDMEVSCVSMNCHCRFHGVYLSTINHIRKSNHERPDLNPSKHHWVAGTNRTVSNTIQAGRVNSVQPLQNDGQGLYTEIRSQYCSY